MTARLAWRPCIAIRNSPIPASCCRCEWPLNIGARGAAEALLDTLFRWGIDEAGFLRVLAEVKANNVRALGFYRRYGFVHRADIQASDPDEIVLEWTPGANIGTRTP